WKGKIGDNKTSDKITGFEDWLPTLLELVGAKAETPSGLDGFSFAPTLLGKKQDERPFLYRESSGYGGQQSIRVGQWKAIRRNLHPGQKAKVEPTPVELYNLDKDESEATNVADNFPDVVKQLSALMKEQHQKSELFPMRALDVAQ
ncbi:MAG: sulfatase/phosphatase domain-containing protein, partial [Pirellulaceae bacterium]